MIWPITHNWKGGVKETLQFKTEVFRSRDGTEQRRALRTTPRRSVSLDVIADGDKRRDMEGLLNAARGGDFHMADPLEFVRTTSALPASATTFTVASVPAWLVVGASIALVSRRRVHEVTVASVSGTTVDLVAPAGVAIAAGAKLHPLVLGRLSSDARATMVTESIGTLSEQFDVLPTTEPLDEGSPDFGNWYRGREIFMQRLNWRTPPRVTFGDGAETVDYGRGRIARILPLDFTTRSRQALHTMRSAAAVNALKQFFVRQKGQRGDFYTPTWTDDIPMAAVTEGSSTMLVPGRGLFDGYANDPVYRNILILMTSGFYVCRTISSITLSGGNSLLTFDLPWAYDLAPQDVRRICWMPVSRFAADTLTINWPTAEVAETTVTIMSLLESAPEGPADDLDELTAYMISTYGWTFTEDVLCDPLQWAVNVRYPQIASA